MSPVAFVDGECCARAHTHTGPKGPSRKRRRGKGEGEEDSCCCRWSPLPIEQPCASPPPSTPLLRATETWPGTGKSEGASVPEPRGSQRQRLRSFRARRGPARPVFPSPLSRAFFPCAPQSPVNRRRECFSGSVFLFPWIFWTRGIFARGGASERFSRKVSWDLVSEIFFSGVEGVWERSTCFFEVRREVR